MTESSFETTLEFIKTETINKERPEVIKEANPIDESNIKEPFSIKTFSEELSLKSSEKNKARAMREVQNVTGHDIASGCIRSIVYKLRNTPVRNYSDTWLPISMRGIIGSSIHEFIQGQSDQFDEIEPNIIVPSQNFYGKIDYMINNSMSSILGEIKSCPWKDYAKICKNKKPREKDYLQAMTYLYILETYNEECKLQTNKIRHGGTVPLLEKYNVNKIQFIYVAHDIITADLNTIGECIRQAADTRKKLKSARNPFVFITSLVIDITKQQKEEIGLWVQTKLDSIKHYMSSNTTPQKTDPYIDKGACFFCMYKDLCDI